MANTHRKESWTAGVLSFGGKDYPIVAGNTYSAAPVGIGTYLAEGERYVIFWERGDNQGIFQTSLESTYDRASKKRVIVAEITVPSSASGNFVDGNDVKADIKADGQASTLTDVSHIWKGTAALPAYSFSGDVDTGMYSDTADQIQFSTGGTQRLEISSSGVTATTFIGALTGNADTATSASSATTAAVATSVTASANDSTNETVYPTFVDGAIGTQGIETDTGLTYNPSSGVLTSTSFTGALTGNADTATSLSGSLSNVTATGWFRGDDGVLAAPEFSFTSDTDTGIYRASEDHLSLSAGGQSITISEAVVTSGSVHYMGIYPTNTADGTGMDGTTGKPYINLGTYPDTSSGWNSQPFNGLVGYYHFAGDGTDSYPSFTFTGDPNTGFYRIASGHVGYSDDSILRVNFGSHSFTPSGDDARTVDFSVSGTAGFTSNIYSSGCRPTDDDEKDLGHAIYRWDDIYATNNTIQTSDIRLKEDITPTKLGLDFINDLNPVSYKWKNKKEGKQDQTHYGIIAQEVIESLKKYGIDSLDDFGGLHKDITGEDDRYGARYTEFIPILMKAVQELSAEIKELKEKN